MSFHTMSAARPAAVWILLCMSLGAVEPAQPDLYYFLLSPPSRMVLMTARLLGTDVNVIDVIVPKGEQLKSEYIQMNPQHTVPYLVDNGFGISESRVIAGYLADVSPNGEKLYPKDLKKRAAIDSMLYFDVDKLYPRVLNFFTFDKDAAPMVFGAPFDQLKKDRLDQAFEMLEKYLSRSEWVAGDEMSIADVAILTTISFAEGIGYDDIKKFPKTLAFLNKMKIIIPDYKEINEAGIEQWKNAGKNATAGRARTRGNKHYIRKSSSRSLKIIS